MHFYLFLSGKRGTYEEIIHDINNIILNKIKKQHLTNYLKHSFRIYNDH
jgi:hypothetical protein